MSYDKSLTESVHSHISTVLAQKIVDANTAQKIGRSIQEIRAGLTDPETLCTPDFVLRRYLQAWHPGMLREYKDLPDLVTGGQNLPWPEEVLADLSGKLEALSKEQGAAISATEWRRYFHKSVPNSREKVFRIAFTLKMNVEQTLDLLLAFGMEPYSVRQPLDMVCLFCQKVGGSYTWAQARQMLEEYVARREDKTAAAEIQPELSTNQVQMDLNKIFDLKLQSSNAQKALVDYMVEHSGEFISFRDKDKEVFLSGFSRQRAGCYQRLCAYLAVLYPKIYIPAKRKDSASSTNQMDLDQSNKDVEYTVSPKTGKVLLPALVRAMFADSGWNDVLWSENAPKGSFEDTMHKFCSNYKQHIDKVNRLFTGGNNIAFFDRRDALLFSFFLISGYVKLLDYGDGVSERQMERLNAMTETGKRFDSAIGQVLKKLEAIYIRKNDARAYFQGIRQCFNLILAQLGQANLYLPAQFDRFVMLAILAADPEEMAYLLMSEAEAESYNTPFAVRNLPQRS